MRQNLITFIIDIKMIKVIQILSYLINGVLQKKDTKGGGLIPLSQRVNLVLEALHLMLACLLNLCPSLNPQFFLCQEFLRGQLCLKRFQLRRMGSKIFLDPLFGSL